MSIFSELLRLVRDTAHFANSAKNSSSIYLGNHLALTNLYTGQLVIVDTRDRSVAPYLLMKGEWEFHYGEYFRSLVKRGSHVVDVGANFGYFGLIASTENLDGTTVYVEANPIFREALEQNIFLNGYSLRSSVYTNSISDTSGELEQLVIPGVAWGSATIGGPEEAKRFASGYGLLSETTSIQSISLDTLADREGHLFDLIKLDIERGEERALLGATSMLKQADHIEIFMEYSFGAPGSPQGAYSPGFFEFLKLNFSEIRLVRSDGSDRRITKPEQLVFEDQQVFAMVHLIR